MRDFSDTDERIYVAFRDIFTGHFATIRSCKRVRRFIRKHQDEQKVAALLVQYGIQWLATVVLALLEENIFESADIAVTHFRHLHNLTRESSTQTSGPEEEVWRAWLSSRMEDSSMNIMGNFDSDETIHLPPQMQHSLLQQIKALVQQLAFDLGRKYIPKIMQDRRWDQSQSLDLLEWNDVFRFEVGLSNVADAMVHISFLNAVAQIAKAVGSSSLLSFETIQGYVTEAESLAISMDDTTRTIALGNISRSLKRVIEDFKRNDKAVHSKCAVTLASISSKRAELGRLEAAAIANLNKERTQNKEMATQKLGYVIRASKNE